MMGRTQQMLEQNDQAQKAFRQALAIVEHLAEQFPGQPEYPQAQGELHILLGNLYLGIGQLESAEHAYQKALAIQDQLVQDHPGVASYENPLGVSHLNLASLRAKR